MTNKKIAIIGGSGLTDLPFLKSTRREIARTPYGDPSSPFLLGEFEQHEVVFMQRHGVSHSIPPHKVNYRANLWALKSMQVEEVIAVAATGGIQAELGPQSIVIPHQIIDYTYGREHTYFDGSKNQVHHIDFSEPYAEAVRQRLINAAKAAKVDIIDSGVYAATQGPRLETAAEIDRMEADGATIVGMTGMPEAALARELELDYACLSLVVNLAAGRSESEISLDEIKENMRKGMGNITKLMEQALA
ncbi:MAG: 5'-methylthioinosine phosphorylase [Gammaproteobacteria bacterium]